jgi:PAS domain S-box-containing protein
MLEWLWRNAETLAALAAVAAAAAPLIAVALRKLLISKRRFDKVMAVLDPEEGPTLGETLQTLLSGMRVVTSDVGTLKNDLKTVKAAQQGMIARQRASYEGEECPVFEADVGGNAVYANQRYLDLIGRSLDEIRGRGWEVILHRDDRRKVIEEWRAAVEAQRTYEDVFRVVARNGAVIRVKCVAKPLVCEDRAITGFLGRYVEHVPAT